jgi:hypothetical protein
MGRLGSGPVAKRSATEKLHFGGFSLANESEVAEDIATMFFYKQITEDIHHSVQSGVDKASNEIACGIVENINISEMRNRILNDPTIDEATKSSVQGYGEASQELNLLLADLMRTSQLKLQSGIHTVSDREEMMLRKVNNYTKIFAGLVLVSLLSMLLCLHMINKKAINRKSLSNAGFFMCFIGAFQYWSYKMGVAYEYITPNELNWKIKSKFVESGL